MIEWEWSLNTEAGQCSGDGGRCARSIDWPAGRRIRVDFDVAGTPLEGVSIETSIPINLCAVHAQEFDRVARELGAAVINRDHNGGE